MCGGSIKGQGRWNISSDTGLRRYVLVIAANSRVRDGEAWRCLDSAGIPACSWYRIPLWIKLDTERSIMPYILYLAQSRKGCRCHHVMSTPMYDKM